MGPPYFSVALLLTGPSESVLCGPGLFTSQIKSSKAVPFAPRSLSAFLSDWALLFHSMIPHVVLSPAPAPVPWATGEVRTCWPGSQGPLPQFQVETGLLSGTCQWLSALPEHSGLWPRTVAKNGSTTLSDSTSDSCALSPPGESLCLPPSWSLAGASSGLLSGCPWALILPASPASFGAQSLPPPFLSAQYPWRGWGLAFYGSLNGLYRGYAEAILFH